MNSGILLYFLFPLPLVGDFIGTEVFCLSNILLKHNKLLLILRLELFVLSFSLLQDKLDVIELTLVRKLLGLLNSLSSLDSDEIDLNLAVYLGDNIFVLVVDSQLNFRVLDNFFVRLANRRDIQLTLDE